MAMLHDATGQNEQNSPGGLPGYGAFCKQVQERLFDPRNLRYVMAVVNIDYFTILSELRGRKAAEEVVWKTAEILGAIAKKTGGVAGYFGRDDFGLLFPCDGGDCTPLFHEAYRQSGYTYPDGFSPSVGLYVIQDKTASVDQMFDRARIALESVSDSITDHIGVYDASAHEQMRDRLSLLLDARRALKAGEFTFYLQPKCVMDTGKIVGAEALVRWLHAERGMISPGAFIPVMEQHHCISMLDRYVWEEVCKWQRQLLDDGVLPVPISVNVSRIDFMELDVEQIFTDLIERYALDPHLLELEITESAFIQTGLQIETIIQHLRDKGFKILMDDFGTGYSSLHSLRELSFDILKTDIRFLDKRAQSRRGIDLMESIQGMARLSGVPMIVEGVETREQVDDLISIGCRYAQGYYFHKPMPKEVFLQMLVHDFNVDREGIVEQGTGQIRLSAFLENNLHSDETLNNILGPVLFLERIQDQVHLVRYNDGFEKLLQSEFGETNRKELFDAALQKRKEEILRMMGIAEVNLVAGCSDVLLFNNAEGESVRLHVRLFLVNEREGKQLFYAGVEKMEARWSDEDLWNELRQTKDRLSFLLSALNRLPNPIFVKDEEARFLFFNDQYARAFGMHRSDYIGKTVLELDYLPKADRERFQKEDVSLIEQEKELSYEADFTFSDDQRHNAGYWSSGVHDKHTGKRGLIGEIVDLSRWKEKGT